MALIGVGACGGDPDVGPAASPTPAPAPGAAPTILSSPDGGSGGKPRPPLEVRIDLEAKGLVVGADHAYSVRLAVSADAPRAAGRRSGTGIVLLTGADPPTWSSLRVGDVRTAPGSFRLQAPGEGELRAGVDVLDDAGGVVYGQASVVYFLATEREVLSGTVSPTELRLELLDRDRTAGRVTGPEHERRRAQILGGGATETRR